MESLEELKKQIEELIKKEEELEDTLAKEELAKNRFRHANYGDCEYWVKVLTVNETNCDVVLVSHIDDSWRLSRQKESMLWLYRTEVITEETYISKFNDIYQLVKC